MVTDGFPCYKSFSGDTGSNWHVVCFVGYLFRESTYALPVISGVFASRDGRVENSGMNK
jgi:hypothetical protein